MFCVASALFDHRGACAGAVSATGVKTDLPAWRIQELGQTVRAHAEQITGLLGGRPPGGRGAGSRLAEPRSSEADFAAPRFSEARSAAPRFTEHSEQTE